MFFLERGGLFALPSLRKALRILTHQTDRPKRAIAFHYLRSPTPPSRYFLLLIDYAIIIIIFIITRQDAPPLGSSQQPTPFSYYYSFIYYYKLLLLTRPHDPPLSLWGAAASRVLLLDLPSFLTHRVAPLLLECCC